MTGVLLPLKPDQIPLPESIPIDSIVAEFSHLGEDFKVQRQIHNLQRSSYSFVISDSERVTQGQITGKNTFVGKRSHFIPISSENQSTGNGRHIPHLVSTSIGEIALQSNEELVWHSSLMLTRKGRRMYEALYNEVQAKGSRFYGKLMMSKWSDDNDGHEVQRYSIQRINNHVSETSQPR